MQGRVKDITREIIRGEYKENNGNEDTNLSKKDDNDEAK